MISVFVECEKFRRFTPAIFFKCAPVFRALIERKSNHRQDFGEKLLCPRPVSHEQIDVIKEATLQSSGWVSWATMRPRINPSASGFSHWDCAAIDRFSDRRNSTFL